MPSDRSRTSDDQRQQYKAVVMQQGRVILDRDFNAMQDILNGAWGADLADIIGPCGTPDDGFSISLEDASSPPALWLPPSPLSPPASNEPWDFLISPGTMYIGGQRAEFPAGSKPGLMSYSYFDQPDWINPDPAPESPATEVVSLHLFEQEVSSVEDPDLLDVALGGPDTTQRVKLMRRVERSAGAKCSDAALAWSKRGFGLDPVTMRLLPQVALKAGYPALPTTKNPCDPVATGGYLGAFNQTIRIEIRHNSDHVPMLLWGYDNASSIYRVTAGSDGKTLTLMQSPVDAFHQPAQNQVVEVLRTAAVLASDPNTMDRTQPPTVRCVAERTGLVTTLAQAYSPSADGSGGTVVLANSLGKEYTEDTQLFLRVWNGMIAAPTNKSIELVDYASLSTGLAVTLSLPAGAKLIPDGVFWMLAVRPGTPQAVYPERFLESPQPPDGPKEWMCPLAVIDWTGAGDGSPPSSPPGPNVQNCRNSFDNLVSLTKRKLGGCCSVTLHPEDLETDPAALQKAADSFAGAAGGIAICLAPGIYQLGLPLWLDASHSGLTIEACNGAVTLTAADPENTAFIDGLIAISNSADITLKGIEFQLPVVPFRRTSTSPIFSIRAPVNVSLAMMGVRLFNTSSLAIKDCQFTFPPSQDSSVNTFAAGIFAGGNCSGLAVSGSSFVGPQLKIIPLRVAPVLAQSADNLKAIGAAIKTAGTLPKTLGELVTANLLKPATFLSPNSTKAPPADSTPDAAATWVNQHSDYVYLGASPSTATAAQPLAYENVDLSNPALDGVNVLFNDGHVQFVAPGDLQQMLGSAGTASLNLGATTLAGHATPTYYIQYGCLALPWVEISIREAIFGESAPRINWAVTDGWKLRDNTFQDLTVPVLLGAAIGMARFEGNRGLRCASGLWLESLGTDNEKDIETFGSDFAKWLTLATQLNGLVSSREFFLQYPLQKGVTTDEMDAEAVSAPVPSIFINDNDFSALPPLVQTSGPALFVAASVSPGNVSASVIVSANHFQNRSPSPFVPTATIYGAGQVVVSGNVITNAENTAGVNIAPQSLFVQTASGNDGPPDNSGLVVTGNFLKGASNLKDLTRPQFAGTAPVANWLFANSQT